MEEKNLSEDKKKVQVVINGESYILLTGEKEEYIQGISNYINNKIKEISTPVKNITRLKNSFYIWLCLNISDDLFKQRQLYLKDKNNLDAKLKKEVLKNNDLYKQLEKTKEEIKSLKEDLEKELLLREKTETDNDKADSNELENLNNEIYILKQENKILKTGFNKFSEQLNVKLSDTENTEEINDIINIHNEIAMQVAKELEKLKFKE